jgi:hypothetical protein
MIFRPTARKPGGRPPGTLNASSRLIRDAVLAVHAATSTPYTVRGLFYALEVAGVVPKTTAGYRAVQRQVLAMRREGQLPWDFVSDSERWQRKPETWDSVDDALAETARTYRRNLWRSQRVRVEVWLEKNALAGVVEQATFPWDVPLMVSRGQSSETFCYYAARAAAEAWRHGVRTHVFALYDSDSDGRDAAAKVEEKLRRYSDGAPVMFELLAVTDEQIDRWQLPTRPDKKEGRQVVELDAIPPHLLVQLVNDAIASLVDPHAWKLQQLVETDERQILERLVATQGRTA